MKSLIAREPIAILLSGLAVVFTALFWPTLATLHQRWMNPDEPYSSSYLVLVMAAYLIWKTVRSISISAVSPCLPALLIIIPAILAWYAGYVTQAQLLSQIFLPVILFSWFFVVLGWAIARGFLFPFLLCYFTIPVWGVLGIPLRTMAVIVVEKGLALLEIPAFISGFQIHLTAGVVEIAGGCSGQNYLISGLVIGLFYAANYLRGYSRLFCIVLIASFSIIANWIRIFLLVLVGHYTNLQHPLVNDHSNFGWFIFALVLLAFFMLMRWLDPYLSHVKDTGKLEGENSDIGVTGKTYRNIIVVTALTLFISAILPVYAYKSVDKIENAVRGMILPEDIIVNKEARPYWLPDYQGYDIAQQWISRIGGKATVITALIYNQQTQGKELIYGANQIVPPEIVLGQSITEKVDNNRLAVTIAEVAGQARKIFWVYRIGDNYTTSGFMAKLLQLSAELTNEPQAALITFSIACADDCSQDIDRVYIREVINVLAEIKWDKSSQ